MNKDINNLQKLYESQEQSITLDDLDFNTIPKNYTGYIRYTDGTQAWCRNGKFHREDGPAIIYHNGDQFWYRKGKLHREDGPTIIYPDGQYWYLNSKQYSKDEYWRKLYKLGKITQEELFVELL